MIWKILLFLNMISLYIGAIVPSFHKPLKTSCKPTWSWRRNPMSLWSAIPFHSWRNPQFLRKSANKFGCRFQATWLYGLLKTHKQGDPLRPAVSATGASIYCLATHLACLLGSHTGNSPHYVKNWTDFVCTLGSLQVKPQDIMVMTRVPIMQIMCLLSWHFEEDILRLFHHGLTAS
jgi:hypothetical protein